MGTFGRKCFKKNFESDFTWLSAFMRNVQRFSEKTALFDADKKRSYSYRELNALSDRLAAALANDGLRKNSLLLVFLHNSLEFLVSYIAAKKVGAVFLPASCKASQKEILSLIRGNRPKVVISSLPTVEFFFREKSFLKRKIKCLVVTETEGAAFGNWCTVGERTEAGPSQDGAGFERSGAPFVNSRAVDERSGAGPSQAGTVGERSEAGPSQAGASFERTEAGPSQVGAGVERSEAGPSQDGANFERSGVGPSQDGANFERTEAPFVNAAVGERTGASFVNSATLSSTNDALQKLPHSLPDAKKVFSFEDYIFSAGGKKIPAKSTKKIYEETVRFCTSGTSALPKLVPLSEANEIFSAHDAIMHFSLTSRDVTLNTNPWFHRGGLHALGPCSALYCGASLVACKSFRPSDTLELIEKYKITYITGAPANLNLLAKIECKRKRNLSSLRGVISLGAVLTKSEYKNFQENLCPNIFNNYGTTETFWNTIFSPWDLKCDLEKLDCVPAGFACLDDDVRIVKMKENSFAQPDDLVKKDNLSEGEIIIRSPAKSTNHYFKNRKVSKEKFYKGFFYTGDTGVWTEEGLITVKGRKDDMIIISGENVYPERVEDAVKENDKIIDCIVTSLPDTKRGQTIALYVLAKDKSLTLEEVADFCSKSKNLNRHSRPHYFAFIDEIPLNSNGKKKRRLMKERALKDFEAGFFVKN